MPVWSLPSRSVHAGINRHRALVLIGASQLMISAGLCVDIGGWLGAVWPQWGMAQERGLGQGWQYV